MEQSFQNIINNRFDRNFGGTNVGVADPYITGYQFCKSTWIDGSKRYFSNS